MLTFFVIQIILKMDEVLRKFKSCGVVMEPMPHSRKLQLREATFLDVKIVRTEFKNGRYWFFHSYLGPKNMQIILVRQCHRQIGNFLLLSQIWLYWSRHSRSWKLLAYIPCSPMVQTFTFVLLGISCDTSTEQFSGIQFHFLFISSHLNFFLFTRFNQAPQEKSL